MKERIKFIDIAKCIAMFLVIHNHFDLNYNNQILKIIIASFHMPLFFILSGITIKKGKTLNNFFEHIKKRIMLMYIPFILWSLIYIEFNIKNILLILYGSNHSIGVAGGAGGSWFIPCFLVADILCYLSYYLIDNKKKLALFSLGYFMVGYLLGIIRPSFGMPFSLDVSFIGAAFICIGLFIKKSTMIDKIKYLMPWKKLVISIILLILTYFVAISNKQSYDNEYGRVVMALAYYGNILLFILSGIIGSLSVIILASFIDDAFEVKLIDKIGKNTLLILLLQQITITYIEKLLKDLIYIRIWITPIVLSTVVLLICHFISLFITTIYPNLRGEGIMKIRREINNG